VECLRPIWPKTLHSAPIAAAAVDSIAAMPNSPKLRLIALLVAVVSLFAALPAVAQATLVFSRNPLNPVVFKADDNGSNVLRIGPGYSPKVSPDGETIVFFRGGGGRAQKPELMAVATAGGPVRRLAVNWQDNFVFAWAPDSQTIAVLLGPELGRQKLTTINVVSGAQHTVSSGYFNGVSFSPENPSELVYGRAANEKYPPKTNVFRASLSDGATVQLTKDNRSEAPLWGPSGKVVFVKLVGEKQRKYGPKNELYLISPSGQEVKRLTKTKVDPLTVGLSPTEWSASGNQLLAEYGGQDTAYAVTVNPKTGAEKTLTKEREVGFIGTALSSDGSSVLGWLGGFEPGPNKKVVSIPYKGGKPKVLVTNAAEPDWSR
jgi:Tol biopolymer transport system component